MYPEIFKNIEFFFLLPFALLFLQWSKKLGREVFTLSTIFISVAFISSLPGIQLVYVFLLVALVSLVYIALFCLLFMKSYRRLIFWAMVLFLPVTFFVVKYSFWAVSGSLSQFKDYVNTSLLPIVGLSFLIVKLYSAVIDGYSGRVKSLRYLDFLSYCFWFPSFMSGPIERFPQYVKSIDFGVENKRFQLGIFLANLPRFTIGLFKIFFIAGVLSEFSLPHVIQSGIPNKLFLIYIACIAYYWYEYMNFSGYSDLSISTSNVVGIKLPENFNHPYLATSLTDLWRRWHMSFANWLRDYIFYPLFFQLAKRSKRSYQVYLSSFSIFLTFAFCGLWHGETYGMLFFGLTSGLVLGIEVLVKASLSSPFSNWQNKNPIVSVLYPWIARIFTFQVATITFAPVLLNNEQFLLLFDYLLK